MPHYQTVGAIPPKRHTQFRAPTGELYAEELMGAEGFSADSALLYHRYLPTAMVAANRVPDWRSELITDLPLQPRHFRTQQLTWENPDSVNAVTGRKLLFGNADVAISVVEAQAPSPLYRNAVGDELHYVRTGSAVVETIFGALTVSAGDYLVLPTSCTYRVIPVEHEDAERLQLLIVEATGHIGPPQRYLSQRGQFLEHSPYCERDIRTPTEPCIADGTDVPVLVRHRTGITEITYAHHPFDVVGWDGCLYPWVFNISDFEPITGRVHQPPPVHQTFAGPNFVVCSFCPRKVDYHPLAIPVPYNHANVDSDELMFYVGGNYEARKGSGIELGSLSLHPAGCTHGPQPGSVEASLGVDFFEETAVMVDTFRPLYLATAAMECEDPAYAWSWARRNS